MRIESIFHCHCVYSMFNAIDNYISLVCNYLVNHLYVYRAFSNRISRTINSFNWKSIFQELPKDSSLILTLSSVLKGSIARGSIVCGKIKSLDSFLLKSQQITQNDNNVEKFKFQKISNIDPPEKKARFSSIFKPWTEVS